MDQGSLTMAQARALAFLFGGAKTGPQLRAALGYRPGESGNFAKVTTGLREAGYTAVRFGDDRHCTRTYSITEAGRAALAETFDGAIAGASEPPHVPAAGLLDDRIRHAAPALYEALKAMVEASRNDNRGLVEARRLADTVLAEIEG
jgi:DNA-binding MarR family transcriptional regulator